MRAFRSVVCLMICSSRAGLAGCDTSPTDGPPATTEEPVDAVETTETWFSEAAAETGLDFIHFNGMTGQFYQPEVMAPGVGLFDYDNDGDLDVYLVQGRTFGVDEPSGAARDGREPGDRLYRNDLNTNDGARGSLHFTDVTTESGILTPGYGMGVATGDIDNDGDVDLYVTGVGRNQMFRNDGDGTFTDVSEANGTDDTASWGVSAGFVDFDRDGWLDLFVGNYLQFDLANRIACVGVSGLADYCRPSAYRPQPNRLYRNQSDGRFVDVTIGSGLAREFGPALGVATADFNADGWPDLFVANDGQENQLWINQQDGTFENSALMAGAALGPAGERKADMGVDAADFDADGDEDLFVTELTGQGSTLYVNDGAGLFEEQSTRTGLRGPSLRYTGFGTGWLDFDNDGWLDLIDGQRLRWIALPETVASTATHDPFPLGQRNHAVPQSVATGASRTSPIASRRGVRPRRRRAAAPPSAMSTTTVTPTLSSATEPDRSGCCSTRSATVVIGSGSGWSALPSTRPRAEVSSRRRAVTCSELGSRSSAPTVWSSGGVSEQMEATPRQTIRACWSGSDPRQMHHESGSSGPTDDPNNGQGCRSIGIRR